MRDPVLRPGGAAMFSLRWGGPVHFSERFAVPEKDAKPSGVRAFVEAESADTQIA